MTLGGVKNLMQSSQGCLFQTIPPLSLHRISVSPQYTLLAFLCQGGTPQWSAHPSIPPGSGALPFPGTGVWRHALYGRCSLVMLRTRRDIFAIKGPGILRDSRIPQNIVSRYRKVVPHPAVERASVAWRSEPACDPGKDSSHSQCFVKSLQISSYLVLEKG